VAAVEVAYTAVGRAGGPLRRLRCVVAAVLLLWRSARAGLERFPGASAWPRILGERAIGTWWCQQRRGSVRSRMNAVTRSVAQGQERCRRTMTRRAWRATRAATWSSR